MGNNYCIHCGCPQDYYSDFNHYSRQSCLVSHDNFHTFESEGLTIVRRNLNKIETCLSSCFKKIFKKNKSTDIQVELSKSIINDKF